MSWDAGNPVKGINIHLFIFMDDIGDFPYIYLWDIFIYLYLYGIYMDIDDIGG